MGIGAVTGNEADVAESNLRAVLVVKLGWVIVGVPFVVVERGSVHVVRLSGICALVPPTPVYLCDSVWSPRQRC